MLAPTESHRVGKMQEPNGVAALKRSTQHSLLPTVPYSVTLCTAHTVTRCKKSLWYIVRACRPQQSVQTCETVEPTETVSDKQKQNQKHKQERSQRLRNLGLRKQDGIQLWPLSGAHSNSHPEIPRATVLVQMSDMIKGDQGKQPGNQGVAGTKRHQAGLPSGQPCGKVAMQLHTQLPLASSALVIPDIQRGSAKCPGSRTVLLACAQEPHHVIGSPQEGRG